MPFGRTASTTSSSARVGCSSGSDAVAACSSPPPLAGEGWGGGSLRLLRACGGPLPIPPAEVGFIRLRPLNEWPNSGKPEFGRKREREEIAARATLLRRRPARAAV